MEGSPSAGALAVSLQKRPFSLQASPGEALSKEEFQSGVDVANQIAESVLKSELMFLRNPARLCPR